MKRTPRGNRRGKTWPALSLIIGLLALHWTTPAAGYAGLETASPVPAFENSGPFNHQVLMVEGKSRESLPLPLLAARFAPQQIQGSTGLRPVPVKRIFERNLERTPPSERSPPGFG